MIRRQMDCAGNNCSRPRSSEEERVLSGGLVSECCTEEAGVDAGLEGQAHARDLHLWERPGKRTFMSNDGQGRAGSGDSASTELERK